jgi:hypothetical protein
MPRQAVSAHLLRTQAAVAAGRFLARDHNSPHDPIIADDANLDLTEGNVFYTTAERPHRNGTGCTASPKLALLVDDRWEITLLNTQTAAAVKELFSLARESQLWRDRESPDDQPLSDQVEVRFNDGPVFVSRHTAELLTIIVNKKLFTSADGVKPEMTGREIAALVSKHPDETEVSKLVGGQSQRIALDQKIRICNRDEFEVIRCNVRGGYESSRIERELHTLRAGGADVTVASESTPAVVYHGLRTKPSHPVAATDVLVTVPGGYPAVPLDGAYLPEGSPLLGRVPGSPQGSYVTASGRRWQLVSYHPHNGGGGPPWDKDAHGFHTYYDYLLAWLRA